MTIIRIVFIATFGAAALLLAAFAFEYIGGLAPCKLCIWQRWPHAAAIVIGTIILIGQFYKLIPLGFLAATTALIAAIYHVGVEQKFWQGTSTCTATTNSNISAADLLDNILKTPIVRCDEIPWEMFTISLAGWNAIFSVVLVFLWLLAYKWHYTSMRANQ